MANIKKDEFMRWLDTKISTRGMLLSKTTIERYIYYYLPYKELLSSTPTTEVTQLVEKIITEQPNVLLYSALKLYCVYRDASEPKRPAKVTKQSLRDVIKLEKKVLTMSQVKFLIKTLDKYKWDDPTTYQAYCMVPFMYDTACRVDEMHKTRWSDVEFITDPSRRKRGEYSEIRLNGKGGKNRTVFCDYLATKIMYEIRHGLNGHGKCHPEFVFRFKRLDGAYYENPHIQIHHVIKFICGQILGRDDMHPHFFRHTRLTHMADDNVALIHIMAYAGHTTPLITMKYIHISKSFAQKAFVHARSRQHRIM